MNKVKPHNEPLSSSEHKQYQQLVDKLYDRLAKDGMSQDMILKNPELAQRFIKWVELNFVNNRVNKELADAGIVQKLVVFEVEKGNSIVGYPVIHRYLGHWLMESIYFRVNISNPDAFIAEHIKLN